MKLHKEKILAIPAALTLVAALGGCGVSSGVKLEGGPVGDQKSRGLEIAESLRTASVDDRLIATIGLARQRAGGLPNSSVGVRTNRYIDTKLALVASEAADRLSPTSSPETNRALDGLLADAVNTIQDPAVKQLAGRNLDYAEAAAAIDTMEGVVDPDAVAALIAAIDDREIQSQAFQAGSENSGRRYAAISGITVGRHNAVDRLETADEEARQALYAGSSRQADDINGSVADWQRAVTADGE